MADDTNSLTPLKRLGGKEQYRLTDDTGEVVWLPVPTDLGRLFIEQVEQDVARMRGAIEERGGVVSKQDVFPPLRHIQMAIELAGEYQRVLKRAAGDLKSLMEEVAADGVGADDDGKPVAPLTVPDRDGDISIRPAFKNTYTITPEQVLPAFASMFADLHADAIIGQVVESANPVDGDDLPGVRAKVGALIAEAITDALGAVEQLGKFELQVTKVRAYRDHLAREGHDNAASIVDAAIHKSRDYDGLKVERKQ